MNSISVIVPVYHGEQYIANMIRQVEACRNHLGIDDTVEIIFVNDAPDAPLPCDWEAERVRITVLNTDRNLGIQGARLKGLRECQGEYVLFLDQDDLIRPEYFRSQLLSIGKNDAVICKAIHADKPWYSGENDFTQVVSKKFMLGMQWGWNPIASPGQVLLRKQSIPGVWINNLLKHRGADDWLLWLCMISKGCSFARNEDVLYEHIVHENNFSCHLVEMFQSEQEVVRIAQVQKLFSDDDLTLLLDGFFKRNLMRIREQDSLKKKWDILEKWMQLRESQVNLSDYFIQAGLRKIAIYGCAVLGTGLYEELKDKIEVKYFIDQNANKIKRKIPVYSLQEPLPEVDAVIITLIDEAEKVEKNIRDVFPGKIIILKNWIMTLDGESLA